MVYFCTGRTSSYHEIGSHNLLGRGLTCILFSHLWGVTGLSISNLCEAIFIVSIRLQRPAMQSSPAAAWQDLIRRKITSHHI